MLVKASFDLLKVNKPQQAITYVQALCAYVCVYTLICAYKSQSIAVQFIAVCMFVFKLLYKTVILGYQQVWVADNENQSNAIAAIDQTGRVMSCDWYFF